MKLTGLVIAPHSTLNYWEALGEVININDQDNKLDGFTFVKHDGKFFNEIYLLNEVILFKNNITEIIPNINNIISRDRWLRDVNYYKAVSFCNNVYLFLEKCIIEKRYNFFIGEVSCATNEIALLLSLKYNIKFYNLTTSLYNNKFFFYRANDIFGNNNIIKQTINKLDLNTLDFKEKIHSEIIRNLQKTKKSIRYKSTPYFKNIIYNLLHWKKEIFTDQHNKLSINIRALARIYLKSDRFLYENVDNINKTDYYLYYLHYEPDLSTYTWANNYIDQIYLISLISRNLPLGTKIVVKEHPLSKLIRPYSFYKKLKNIPNVILIDSNNSSYNLIIKSKGIITLTGSVGYEGWLLGKPIMVFGNVFYDKFDGVFECKNFDKIYDTLVCFLDYNVTPNKLIQRYYIDQIISEKCTFTGSIFRYENDFNIIPQNEKIQNMQIILNYIIQDLNDK